MECLRSKRSSHWPPTFTVSGEADNLHILYRKRQTDSDLAWTAENADNLEPGSSTTPHPRSLTEDRRLHPFHICDTSAYETDNKLSLFCYLVPRTSAGHKPWPRFLRPVVAIWLAVSKLQVGNTRMENRNWANALHVVKPGPNTEMIQTVH